MTDPVATVPLALFDFVPVVLAGVGCLLLARIVPPSQRAWALVGATLVLLGGLSKAVWKLVFASGGGDFDVLETGLFVLLAPGFVLLGWALASTVGRMLPRLIPLLVIVAAEGVAAALRSTGPLLLVTVLGATATAVLAILVARRFGDGISMLLFGTQLVLAFALVPLAQPPHTVDKQWLEEVVNTFGQGALALGAWRLVRRIAMEPAVAGPPLVTAGSN